MEERQINQFPFYDFYAEILNGLTDEEAGRMAKRMCAFMFTDEPVAEITDGKERFYWGNLVDVLEESKDAVRCGKQSAGLNRRMKHFTFLENFYDALNLLDDKQSGQYVKAICGYMFEDKTPTLKPPIDGFFTLAKRKLDLSKVRRRVGSKGGKAERIPVTSEQVKAADIHAPATIGIDGFLRKYPQIKNDIYKSSVHLTVGVDWTTLEDMLPYSRYSECKSLYQVLTHYKEIVG